MSSVFSASNLLEANFTKPTSVEKININESYFVEALNYLEEMNKDVTASTKVLYRSILEADGDVVAINESFSSFCASIKKIIEKFLEFLKRIVQKFILTMNKLVKSEKYISNHKADIKKFGASDAFKMDVFIFTHLMDDDVPMLNPENAWNQSQGWAAPNATESILNRVTNTYNDVKKDLDGGWYDSFRGRVIGKSSISVDDFAEELFKVFRNNSKEKTEVEFAYDKVIDALNRFEGYNQNLKHVQDVKKVMEKGYSDIKKEIEAWGKAGTDGKAAFNGFIDMSRNAEEYNANRKEIDEQLDLFIKAKVAQVDHMCKIHAMAYTAKLDACKASFTQDKAILYKALSKVKTIKAHKESASDEEERGEDLYELF